MTDPAVPPPAATGAEPAIATSPAPAMPSSAAEVADLFDVLATSADWSTTVNQHALFPVAVSPAERAIADLVAAGARAQLARLDPPVLLAGVAEWAARHPDAADAARASVAGRVDLCWPAEAGA
jgi:hypothetical protein